VEVVLSVLLGWAIAASLLAMVRLPRPTGAIPSSGEGRAMQEALHAATAARPHLSRSLSAESVSRTAPLLRMLTKALAVAVLDRDRVIALDG
jgi:hypothetical protein